MVTIIVVSFCASGLHFIKVKLHKGQMCDAILKNRIGLKFIHGIWKRHYIFCSDSVQEYSVSFWHPTRRQVASHIHNRKDWNWQIYLNSHNGYARYTSWSRALSY